MTSRSFARGFTLVEVVVSTFLVGVSVLFLGTLASLFTAGRSVGLEETATQVAETKIEELRGAGYGALPASGSFTDSLLSTLPGGTASVTVSTYNSATKKVTVGVGWTGVASTTRYLSLTTLITQTGGL